MITLILDSHFTTLSIHDILLRKRNWNWCSEVDGWVDVMERMPPPSGQKVEDDDSDFISELSYRCQSFISFSKTNFFETYKRSIIEEADCDPGIIRKVMGGRSLPPNLDDGKSIRSIIWPALLGVRKRDVGEIETAKSGLSSDASFSRNSASEKVSNLAKNFLKMCSKKLEYRQSQFQSPYFFANRGVSSWLNQLEHGYTYWSR